MAKPILYYTVRTQTSRTTGNTYYVPAIVERDDSIPLSEIVRRAIDRGLIPGLKTSAATGIAEAVARQMYQEFSEGNGVKFGSYFYARLYLDGTTNSNGVLTSANGINVRFANGPLFKLTMDMFSFSNIAGGDIPGVDFLISEATGAVRGVLKPSADISLNGFNLFKEGDVGTSVGFYGYDEHGNVEEQASATVTTFTTSGPNLLKFAYPVSGLVRGKKYLVVPSRSADGERWFTGAGKDVTIEEEQEG